MKKFITISFILLIVFFVNTTVFADAAPPNIAPYEAIISNPDGSEYYAFSNTTNHLEIAGKLDYGEKISIIFEDDINNKLCGHAFYNDTYIYIPLENLEVFDEFIYQNNINLQYEYPINFTVISKDGIKIHNGPADAYKVIGTTIPFGTQITAYPNENTSYTSWYVVTYQGVQGYINSYSPALASISSSIKSLKTYKETEFYTLENNQLVSSDTIPANTIFTTFLEANSGPNSRDPWYYVTYNNKNGYLSPYDIAFISYDTSSYNTFNVPENGITLYEFLDDDNLSSLESDEIHGEILVENIPEGTSLVYDYELLYPISQIQADEYTDYYLLIGTKYENQTGWCIVPEDTLYPNENTSETSDYDYNYTTDSSSTDSVGNTQNLVYSNESVPANRIEIKSNPKNSLKSVSLICVLFAIIGALTALVSTQLINKKKDE